MNGWLLIACTLGALACLGFIFIQSIAEYRAAEPLRDSDRTPCPWPCDDEAEADGLLAEFHPFHSTHVASGAPRDHV